jgi:hypothetical protein
VAFSALMQIEVLPATIASARENNRLPPSDAGETGFSAILFCFCSKNSHWTTRAAALVG